MGYAITTTIVFSNPIDCCTCGILFCVPEDLKSMWLKHPGRSFYCPNGHSMHYTGKSDAQKLKEKEAQLDFERRKNEQLKNSERSLKGQITKLKNRSKAGVCPCCNRTFKQLARHMKSKHPDYEA